MDCFEFDGCKLGYLPAFGSELTTQKTVASRRFLLLGGHCWAASRYGTDWYEEQTNILLIM